MKRVFLFVCTLTLPVLAVSLSVPAPTVAGTADPNLTAMIDNQPDTEAIPEEVFIDPALHHLNRLVFRYEMVHFNVDSSVLLPAGQRALYRKVRWLQEHPDTAVMVEGHCDARGTSAYNIALGRHRAEAARAFLIEHGVAPHRIQIVSWGKARPDVSGDGAAIWFYNRRAEFLPR